LKKKIISRVFGKKGLSIAKKIIPKKIIDNNLLNDFFKSDNKFKIVGFLQVYNENEKGNLVRILNHLKLICDDIVVFDDGSTDDSLEILYQYTNHVIKVSKNDFQSELEHKQKLLDLALTLNPDWIFWLDADEVVDRFGEEGGIRALCNYGSKNNIDGFLLLQYNLWKNLEEYRIDGDWHVWHMRLWRNNGNLRFDVKKGLHQRLYPLGIGKISRSEIKVIHYGHSSEEKNIEKFELYKKHNPKDWNYNIIRDEKEIKLKQFLKSWFPKFVNDV
jgi:glycosyltransferase involved in cell wall biosynthesis